MHSILLKPLTKHFWVFSDSLQAVPYIFPCNALTNEEASKAVKSFHRPKPFIAQCNVATVGKGNYLTKEYRRKVLIA